MSLGEFDLIRAFFERPVQRSPLGIGDDCALLAPQPGMQLAVSTDMLVEGRHFLSTVAPDRLGHKALAVNLSDLAACGARPLAYTLALSLPRADATFLSELARGLHALADAHGIELVGGDTTAGPLNLCITVFGEVPPGQALLRSGAGAGDDLWVSGCVGEARLALEVFRGHESLPGDAFEAVRRAMEQPTPRVALGQALRGVASAAIDISDGLMGDLSHILKRSGGLGACIDCDQLPPSPWLALLPTDRRRQYQLAGGDDYELLFTAAPESRDAVRRAGQASACAVTRIGRIIRDPGIAVQDADGHAVSTPWASFDHFKTA